MKKAGDVMRMYLYLFRRLKGIGISSLVPLAIVFVIFPIAILLLLQLGYDFLSAFFCAGNAVIPIGSIWWIITFFKSYIEDGGREIYYINNKSKLRDVLGLDSIYLAVIVIVYLYYFGKSRDTIFLSMLIVMIVIVMLYGALTYFFLYLTHSTVASYGIMMAYTLYVNTPGIYGIKGLSYNLIALDERMILELIPFVSVMLIGFILGELLNESYRDYN